MRLPSITDKVAVQTLGSELLVYCDGTAHCLSGAAATVFRACQESWTIERLEGELRQDGVANVTETVEGLLAELYQKGLVIDQTAPESRREFLGRTALKVAGAALILSIAAPEPAAAGS